MVHMQWYDPSLLAVSDLCKEEAPCNTVVRLYSNAVIDSYNDSCSVRAYASSICECVCST